MDDLVPGAWLGDWQLEELLGEGGFARVWRARHVDTGQVAALKVGRDPRGEELLRRAAALEPLAHPGLVTTLARHPAHDPPFLVLELVPGDNLRRALEQGPLPPARALAVLADLAEALDFAHEHGRLHLDVKPENVLLDAAGRPRLTDFGALAARVAGQEVQHSLLLSSGQLGAGTRDYAAPELREGAGGIDRRADVYSLGVLAYELLTGRLPLGLDRPSQLQPGLSPALDRALERALRRDPRQRTLSAGALLTELRAALVARADAPQSGASAALPPARRRGGLVAAALVGLLTLAGGGLAALAAHRAPPNPAPDPLLAGRLDAALPPERVAAGTRLVLLPPADLAGRPVHAACAPLEQELLRRRLRPWRSPQAGELPLAALHERQARNELARVSHAGLALEAVLEWPEEVAPRWAFLIDLGSWTVLRATPPRDPVARALAAELLRAIPPGEPRVLAVLPGRGAASGASDAVTAAFDADLTCALAEAVPRGLSLRARAGALERLRTLGDARLALSAGLGVEVTLDGARREAVARLIDLAAGTTLVVYQATWSPPAGWSEGQDAALYTTDPRALERLERHVQGEIERAEEAAAAALWRGEPGRAVAILEALRARGPVWTRALQPLLLLGRAHEEADDVAAALSCYEQAARLAPEDPRPRAALIRAVRAAAERRFAAGKRPWWADDDEREFQAALELLGRLDDLALSGEERQGVEALRARIEGEL